MTIYRFTFTLPDGTERAETCIGNGNLREALAFILLGPIRFPSVHRPDFDFTAVRVEEVPPEEITQEKREEIQRLILEAANQDPDVPDGYRVVFPGLQE